MTNLAYLYRKGQGAPQDYPKAKEWYEKAAAAGAAEAMTGLGGLYARGQGVPQDEQEAKAWYEKAAAAGNVEAQQRLEMLSGAQANSQTESH